MEASDEKMAFDVMMNELDQDSSDDEITHLDSKNTSTIKGNYYISSIYLYFMLINFIYNHI
jgi:hypothetical protein